MVPKVHETQCIQDAERARVAGTAGVRGGVLGEENGEIEISHIIQGLLV